MKKDSKFIKIFIVILIIFTMIVGFNKVKPLDVKQNKGVVKDDSGWKLWDNKKCLTTQGRDDVGKKAIITSAKYEASQAGKEIIESGGNAIDAAVAVGFALCVTEPNATGIAGGGCMLIRTRDDKEIYIDFREKAPIAANQHMWKLDSKGRIVNEANKSGGKSVAVPGEVAGLLYAFENYGSGKVTLEQVMQPAINLAQYGFYVTPTLLKDMKSTEKMMEKYPNLKSVILNKDRQYYNVGDLYKNKRLAKTLKRISKEGGQTFYEGEIAQAIVDSANEYGGILTLEDLKNYNVEVREPVKGTYREKTIISSPSPSSGGTCIIEALNILENFDLSKYEIDSVKRVHLLSETFKIVYADRAKYMGDTDYVDVPRNGLTSKVYAKKLASKIDLNKSQNYKYDDPWIYEHDDTTHYSIADENGNIVSSTQTINWVFGSGVVVDDYGFVLNNEMSDFTPRPNCANSVDGGKKPLSSMSPTIILNEDKKPFLVLGSPGGSRIIPVVTQVISNVIDYNMNIQQAINEYRIYNDAKNKILIEPGLNEESIDELKNKGHKVEVYKDGFDKFFGGVQGIEYKNNELIGGADWRRDGKAIGIN